MKRNFFRGLVVSLFTVAMGAAAHGREPDRLVVNIPCNFVVNGKALPAGKYDVKRNSDGELGILSISGIENRAFTVTLSTEVNDAREFHSRVTLLRVGDQTVLTKIQTAEHVFTIPSEAVTAKAARGGYLTGTTESRQQ